MTTSTSTDLPLVLTEVEVLSARRLSPSFVRLVLGGGVLGEVGVAGPLHDQRFKLIVPDVHGRLPSVAGADETWLRTWLDRPAGVGGHMRTYTIRAIEGTGPGTRVVVDVVVHAGGEPGPGADWAATASPGSRAVVLMPRRGFEFGGIEWAPPPGSDLLLVGDETAVPAVCAILEGLPEDAAGAAFLEVPCDDDVQAVSAPAGVAVTWLPRAGGSHGAALHTAVLEHLGAPTVVLDEPEEIDPDLWETPTWSSSGAAVPAGSGPRAVRPDLGALYAWIAGEAATVTALRRHLVKELGLGRRQVAFMGYWRRGVAMRS
ncbi:Vibriobactin utilization protein ViuB [Nocardioides dokdonensis FR1436]|uniref:Vibriobactin utilization protein ViuB n=1 Tax=Nocardioides dokdonensis FR1436 TaxID=1300347 RepID=A0A1A9GNX1_9ACTN|nr:siderophore-interacting protein [Nocardioides dokdonensis]ANH40027.1 Vibriobactin utilization protein ViuB [Nocardioides dokdonensis FR1436]